MGKAKRLKGKRKRKQSGKGILSDLSKLLTENFQRELRESELWGQMVKEFGEKRAEETAWGRILIINYSLKAK